MDARHWWHGYAKATTEKQVTEDVRALGITARLALQVNAIRQGKQRWAEAVDKPIFRNSVFIHCTDAEWHQLAQVKNLLSLQRLSDKWVERTEERLMDGSTRPFAGLLAFLDKAEADYLARHAAIKAGQRVAEYEPGDLIEILGGPLAGHLARFRKTVEQGEALFPKLRVETDMMGTVVTAYVDPLDARKAKVA